MFRATVVACDEAGQILLRTAVQAGLERKTQVHVVSDGAPWNADQVCSCASDSRARSWSISTKCVTPCRRR